MRKLFAALRRYGETFWFLPAVMCLLAFLLAAGTSALDYAFGSDALQGWDLGYSGGPDGARTLLAIIAGSMVTVASVAFSITIAALALASGQFGPRLIRNFIRDKGNQVVLGTFIATFLYCLLVVRSVRGPTGEVFVPDVSISVALLLALASVGVLIYFIAHISTSIQAMSIIASIGRDLDAAIIRLFPPQDDGGDKEGHIPEQQTEPPRGEGKKVAARRSGYLREVRYRDLTAAAKELESIVVLPHHAGQFVAKGAPIAEIFTDHLEGLDFHEVGEKIAATFALEDDRAADQDIEYFIDQLVEIAVRALSPGVNDPFTAMACIDRLAASLRQLVERQLPSPYHHDEDGRLRVIARAQTFEGALDAAFNLIRQYGHSSPPVAMRLMETLAVLAEHVRAKEHRSALLNHARMIESASRKQFEERADLEALEARYRLVIEALETNGNDDTI